MAKSAKELELELLELELQQAEAEAAAEAESGGSKPKGPAAGRGSATLQDYKDALPQVPMKALEATGRIMDFVGGLTRTGVMEAMERAKSYGTKGVGAENWQRAVEADAKSFQEYLPEVGFKKGLGTAVGGFAADMLTDPLSFTTALSKVPKALKGANTWGDVARATVLNNDAVSMLQAPFNVAKGVKAMGRNIYRMPFGNVAKDMSSYVDASRYKPYEAIDELYESGVSGSTQDLKDAFKSRQNAAYDYYRDATDGYAADLAPKVTQERALFAEEQVESYIGAQKKKAYEQATAGGLDEGDAKAFADQIENALRTAASDENDAFFKQFREQASDKYGADLKETLRNNIAGEPNQRRKAISMLKERLHPQFHNEVDKITKKLDGSEREVALKEIDALMNTGFAGEKTLADLDDIAAGYGLKASGSDAFGTNVYKASGKKETRKALASNTGSNVKGVIDETLPLENRVQYKTGKREYGKWARSKKEFLKAIERSEGVPLMTNTDAAINLLGAGALLGGETTVSPWLLGISALRSGNRSLRNFPELSSKVGQGFNKASRLNLWDNIARRGAIDFVVPDYQEEKK